MSTQSNPHSDGLAYSTKQRRVAAFIRKIGDGHETPMLGEVVGQIRSFLAPVILRVDSSDNEDWQPGGPWKPAS